MTWWCPRCWHQLAEGEQVCPSCGASLSEYEQLAYEEKLMWSLDSPFDDSRLTAIRVLGKKKWTAAAPRLIGMLSKDLPPEELHAVVEALLKIGTEEAFDAVDIASESGSGLVRRIVQQARRGAH